MKIAFIKPKLGHTEDGSYREKAVMEPHVFALLASMTPPDVELILYDDRLEDIPYDTPVDMAAITVETYTARRAYEISEEYRKRGVPVLLGGTHPSHMPDESLQYADSIVIGDAEGQWANVISDFRKGRLRSKYQSEVKIPQKGLFPDRSIYTGKKYVPVSLIQFSRGCGFNCNFCSVATFYKNKFLFRPVNDLVREIEMHRSKLYLFVDDNITFDRKAAKELFRVLIPLRIKWISEGDLNMTNDPELMDLMLKSGCVGLLIGVESLNIKNIRAMHKLLNLSTSGHFDEQMKVLRDKGLMTWATFTLGHEFDTPDIFSQTLDFCYKHKVALADFNILTPYPNTPLYHQLRKENRLLYDGHWWIHPEYRFGKAAHVPHRMTPQELEEGCASARKEFFRLPSVVRRGFDHKTNMRSFMNAWMYYMVNVLSYNETTRKVDLILGDS